MPSPARKPLALAAIAATTLSALSLMPSAYAATAAELAPVILNNPSYVTGSHLLDPSAGQSTMVATTPIAGFPRDGGSFAILSTGKAADAYKANSSGDLGTQFGGKSRGTGNDQDVTVLRIDLNVPAGVNCLTGVDFRFFSEEFPEYVNQGYNDAFIAELDTSTWTAQGDTINAPNNFAFDSQGNVISINASGAATMTAGNAAGTTYDGGSDLLTAATPITPGAHSLYLSIFDQGDDAYDSTVFIDNMRFGKVANVATDCKPGAQAASDEPVEEAPEPTHVTAGPIAHTDEFGTIDDTYTIPATTGVTYLVDGEPKAPGTYAGTGTVTVVAQPADDSFVIDGETSFEITFTADRASDRSTSGVGRAEQSVTVPLPTEGTVHLVDGDGHSVNALSTPAGEYTVEPTSGKITFLPAVGFSGDAQVTFRVTERDGTPSTATYTATVTKPAGPTAAPLTSHAGIGVTQTVEVDGEDPTLLDGEGTPTDEVEVDGEGTYALGEGTLSFTPETCFSGVATPAEYQVTDSYEQSSTSTYTPTVDAPAAPQPQELSSEGTGTEVQHATAHVPECGRLALVDTEGDEVLEVARDGEGSYVLDPATGEITFTPVFGYSGVPAPVEFAEHDGHGNRVVGSYAVTVHAPAAVVPDVLTSTGVGAQPQSRSVTLRTGDVLTLLDGDAEVGEVEVRGQGTYLIDPATGTISFVPAPGFHGQATPVTYQVTDAYGQRSSATFTPTVELPAAPAPTPVRSNGPQQSPQQVQVDVPAGGSVKLLDNTGASKRRVVVKGQGVYELDAATATITFTPRKGFHGKAQPVTFAVTDGYGQVSKASYRAVVAQAISVRLTAPKRVRTTTTLPTTCRVTAGKAKRCSVTAYASVNGTRTVVGKGSVKVRTAAKRVSVPVRLNTVGRSLAAQPGGFKVELASVTRTVDGRDYAADARSLAVAPTMQLRPVYFATDSAVLSKADRRYLLQVRRQLGGVARIVCTGFADARSTVDYNARLGMARAQAVCEVLAHGVRAKVAKVSRGETRPAGDNATERGRALNRRVEVTLKY